MKIESAAVGATLINRYPKHQGSIMEYSIFHYSLYKVITDINKDSSLQIGVSVFRVVTCVDIDLRDPVAEILVQSVSTTS